MFKRKIGFLLPGLLLALAAVSFAAERVETKDKNNDGKADTWYYYKNNAVYKKEYDRNFDGRADFGIVIEGQRLVEKNYDDNFDGKYEKTVKKPEKGATGRIQTTAPV